ncbi:MAG: enoyl-CoA hydratase-related protein [Chloroflexota bacterium]|nr:enoyl-CoA hydratase-related protein [Chloroflexota bacterium]
MRSPHVLYRRDGRVATITLNRPRLSNRVDAAMAWELQAACQRAREEDAWVVVLTGRGAAFACGGERTPGLEEMERHQAARAVAALDRPVVAAINGDALDQGLELALACDIRIAAKGARLGLTQLVNGALPWDGGTQRLARLLGHARALELLLLSRVVDADEACEMGLVHQVVPQEELNATVEELAQRLASVGPIAARYVKEAVNQGLDAPLAHGLRLEADLTFLLQSSADRSEGIRSFKEKRKPVFAGQ